MSNLDMKWIGCAPNNFRAGRPRELEVTAAVIHIIDGSRIGAGATFLYNTLAEPRSAHYAVGADGSVHQCVKECDTAFHAGVVVNPIWKGLRKNAAGEHVNPNFYTISIEHEGTPAEEWTDAMYASSAALLRGISSRSQL